MSNSRLLSSKLLTYTETKDPDEEEAEVSNTVLVTKYKTNLNSWTDAFTNALNDNSAPSDTIGVPPGVYTIRDQIVSTSVGKKLVGLGAFPSEHKLKFEFPDSAAYQNKSGIWARNKIRFLNLNFSGVGFTQAREQNLLRIEKTNSDVLGVADQNDMDSGCYRCTFDGFKKSGSESPFWGNAIYYVGRNIEIDDCSFADCSGTCISLRFNSSPTGTDTNPFQLPFYGHRKGRIVHNLAHIGAGARFLHIHGPVAVRGLQCESNMLDIGGQFLFADGTGGIRDSHFANNIAQHQEDGNSDRSPFIYLKSGTFKAVRFVNNDFTGSDNVNGLIGAGGTAGSLNRRPDYVLRVGPTAIVQGLTFATCHLGYSKNQLVFIEGAVSGFRLVDCDLEGTNMSDTNGQNHFIFAGTNMQYSLISGNFFGTTGSQALINWNNQVGFRTKFVNSLSSTTGTWNVNAANLSPTVIRETA